MDVASMTLPTLRLEPSGARITVRHRDIVVADSRAAAVAIKEGASVRRSVFYLFPRSAVVGDLVPRAEDPALLDLHLADRVLEGVASVEPGHPDHVRLGVDALGSLDFFEESLPTFPQARDPRHGVRVLPISQRVRVMLDGVEVASTRGAKLVLEAGLDGRVYLPESAFEGASLRPNEGQAPTLCPYKGIATYFDLVTDERTVEGAAWGYDRATTPRNWLLPQLDGHRALYERDGLEVVVDDES
ncbi:MAG: DUF427 domain-containing protein [Myxococcota bacterium]